MYIMNGFHVIIGSKNAIIDEAARTELEKADTETWNHLPKSA